MARVIHYEDLALAIEPAGEESYRVLTLSSPYGLTAAPFIFPFRRHELGPLIQEVGVCLFRCRDSEGLQAARDLAPRERWHEPKRSLHKTGARLFRALFHEAVREIYLLSKGRTEALPDRGLRIRLVLPSDTDSALLQALPWELLYCEQDSDFLARSVLTPIVRQLVFSGASSPFNDTAAHRVRILIAVATPEGAGPLDEADERARILQAWGRQQGAEVEILKPATLSGLYEELRSEHYQVVHFIAHGSFDTRTGEGSLLLETPEHRPHFVSGSLLAETLRASRELRLVFLNSCNSAQVGHLPGQDPLLGAAAALVRRGVPAVIAMQFPISDAAARLFSEAVYRSLARGSSLEAAVGDGRLALHQAGSWEWITPALFTALSGPQVFLPLCTAVEDRSSREEEAAARVARLLAARSYERARQVVESCLEEGEGRADLHYYRALALLADRRPRFLKVQEFKPVDASAGQVLRLDDCAAHHLCFLAFLRKDFYLENCLVPPAPGYEELLERAAASSWQPARVDELIQLVPWTKDVVDLARGRVRRGSP